MDEYERNLYLYYFNVIKSSPRIEMKFNPSISDLVQGNEFLHNAFGRNAVRRYGEFKCCFLCQDL